MATNDAFRAMMDVADQRGVKVGLEVGPLLQTTPKRSGEKAENYRQMVTITAEGRGVKLREPISRGDLDAAALRLAPRL